MNNIVVRKPTVESALDTLKEMKNPSVLIPGGISTVALFLLGTNILGAALAVFVSLFIHMLWNRLSVQQ